MSCWRNAKLLFKTLHNLTRQLKYNVNNISEYTAMKRHWIIMEETSKQKYTDRQAGGVFDVKAHSLSSPVVILWPVVTGKLMLSLFFAFKWFLLCIVRLDWLHNSLISFFSSSDMTVSIFVLHCWSLCFLWENSSAFSVPQWLQLPCIIYTLKSNSKTLRWVLLTRQQLLTNNRQRSGEFLIWEWNLLTSRNQFPPTVSLPSISFSLLVDFIYFKWENPLQQQHPNADTLSSEVKWWNHACWKHFIREPKLQQKFLL